MAISQFTYNQVFSKTLGDEIYQNIPLAVARNSGLKTMRNVPSDLTNFWQRKEKHFGFSRKK